MPNKLDAVHELRKATTENMAEYDAIHKSLEFDSAIKREQHLLEGIAPAITFLENKVANATEALEMLNSVRTSALKEIERLEKLRTRKVPERK